jgi:hypothetical protein
MVKKDLAERYYGYSDFKNAASPAKMMASGKYFGR